MRLAACPLTVAPPASHQAHNHRRIGQHRSGILFANLLFAAWWIDAVPSLGIVWFVVKEAHEAWSGEDCCSRE
jgi:hypothetical protein